MSIHESIRQSWDDIINLLSSSPILVPAPSCFLLHYQAVTKDLTSSWKFSGSCVLTLQTLLKTRPSQWTFNEVICLDVHTVIRNPAIGHSHYIDFLCQYAMLKAVPNKNAGFIILFTSIFFFFFFGEFRNLTSLCLFNLQSFSLSYFFLSFLSFLWIGAQFPQEKFLSYARILTLHYYFLLMCILFSLFPIYTVIHWLKGLVL